MGSSEVFDGCIEGFVICCVASIPHFVCHPHNFVICVVGGCPVYRELGPCGAFVPASRIRAFLLAVIILHTGIGWSTKAVKLAQLLMSLKRV